MTVFVLKCASYEESSRICAFGNCPFRGCRAAAFSVVQHLGGLLQESRRGATGGRRVRDSRTQARSRLAAGGHAELVGESALREHEGGGDLNTRPGSWAYEVFKDAGWQNAQTYADAKSPLRSHHGNPVRGSRMWAVSSALRPSNATKSAESSRIFEGDTGELIVLEYRGLSMNGLLPWLPCPVVVVSESK